jgi:hypothetical protein
MLLGKPRGTVVPGPGQHPMEHGDQVASGNIDIARDGRQHRDGASRRDGICILINGEALGDRCGPARGVDPCGLPDRIFRDPGDPPHPLRSVIPDSLRQSLETVAPVLDEPSVVPFLSDDDVQHAQSKGRVRATSLPSKRLH